MERLSLDRWASPWLRHQHLARYHWAAGFVRGCRVLDGASGTAYGARILRDGGASRVECVDRSMDAFRAARRLGGTEGLSFMKANVAQRFALQVGKLCRDMPNKAVPEIEHLHHSTVKDLDKLCMQQQLARAGTPAPRAIERGRDRHSKRA